MGDEVDLKIIQRHCQRQRPPVTVPAPLPVPVLTAVQVLVPLATTVPRSASVSASLPVQVPVSMLLHVLVPIVHFPASVRVQVQSGSSRLEYITWLKWQDIQPINIVKTYAGNMISGCSETTVRSLIRLGSISPNRFPGIKVLKKHRRLIKAV